MTLGYRIAQISFIFHLRKSALSHYDSGMHAFVLWYMPFSPPQPHVKLRIVEKLKGTQGQVGGIIPLERVKLPCALSPVLGEEFWDQVEQRGNTLQISADPSMSQFDKFYLNCFAGHVDYELLR
jgi:hypothetical protein